MTKVKVEPIDGVVRGESRLAERLPLRLVKHVEMIVTQVVGSEDVHNWQWTMNKRYCSLMQSQ